jgi:hypothetical protein
MSAEEPEADFSDLLEHANVGAPLPEGYKTALDMFDNVVREGLHVSRSYGGIPSPTGRHFYASVIYTTILGRAVSLLTLAPHSPWANKVIEHWDYASAAILARAILELRLAFFYLCTEECSEVEWDCKWNIMNLHDCHARIRLFSNIGENAQLKSLEEAAENLKGRLRANSHFQMLTPGQQSKFLNGKSAYLEPLEDIGEKAGIDRVFFRWIYPFLSSHVHGYPLSYYRMGPDYPERGRGLPSEIEEGYTSLFLSMSSTMLVKTSDEVHKLFEGIERKPQEPQTESQAVDYTQVKAVGEVMEIGASREMMEDEFVRIVATRHGEDDFEIAYRHRITDETLLMRSESETNGISIHSLDPTYWNITINGRPATQRMLDQIENFAFKVDHGARSIQFKIPLEFEESMGLIERTGIEECR